MLFLITCTSSDLEQSPAKFNEDTGKIAVGVALRSQDTQSLYASVEL